MSTWHMSSWPRAKQQLQRTSKAPGLLFLLLLAGPTREQCKKVVRREGNQEITRAMELGARKHELALDCARNAFAERFSDNVSAEPTYQKDSSTGLWRWIDPKLIAEWLQLGLTSNLWGA